MDVDVPTLVEQAREGRPRAVARLISLVEGASPQLREVMARARAAAPAAPTSSASPARRASASRPPPRRWSPPTGGPGKRVGVLAVDPSSPFSGGALLGDRVRMSGARRRTPASTSARWPPAATSAASPGPTPAGDPGAGRRRLRRRPGRDGRRRPVRGGDRRARPTPPWCCSRPGMGDGIQAAKAGILEIGDVYVVNKADRDGADADRPRAQPHAGPRRVPGAGRLAAADRQDGRRPRRGHRRDRRGAGEAPGVDGGARASSPSAAAPAPRTRSRRSPSRRCASASATCAATAGSVRWPSGSWPANWTPMRRRTSWWRG